jgi:hypothetical protein
MSLLDEFPSTQRTFITEAIGRGDLLDARNHVMSRAYAPLCAYARASSLRSIASAEDLVGGFFASRFARDEYLVRWLREHPPVPLRRWLVNGLLFSARERVADERRARRATELAEPSMSIESAPWRALERAWRDGVLQAACDRVSELYAREGRTDAWRLFMRHVIDGVAYPALETELAIPTASAPMITRTALRRLRAEIDAILTEEFADPVERARELNAILFEDGDAPS